MIREDLERAGIPFETAAGVADFHALRHTFLSNLAESGAHPKQIQELARHSTITLTMDRYSHLALVSLDRALQGLPPPPPRRGSQECVAEVACPHQRGH